MGDANSKEEDLNPSVNDDFMNQVTRAFDNETKELITSLIDEVSATIEKPTGENKKNKEQKIKPDNIHELTMEDLEKEVMQNNYQYEEEMIDDISGSIAKQINNQLNETLGTKEIEVTNGKKNYKRFIKPAIILISLIVLFGCFFLFTTPGQNLMVKLTADYISSRVNYEDGAADLPGLEQDEIVEVPTDITQLTENEVNLNAEEGEARSEEYATNILLLGEEAIGSDGARGRTDLIMIATLNTRDKSLKLTSLMRDSYVQIPGYRDNKLNSAYATGGIDLLYQTIEMNFDIKIDGYCMVGFDDFEEIIDELGGVNIYITEREANYLNANNYITEIKNRNLVEGMNTLNGDQALGYCRIRDVGTADKEYNDFGRTSRQRVLLNAIFEKYKEKNLIDLMLIINRLLPKVTTNLTSNDFANYMKIAYNIGLNEIQDLRIPADGTYQSTYIRDMSVIIPNLSENVKILHEFVFGENDDTKQETEMK
ncbi:LCP family protein [Clostridium sp. Marseille-P299]|uniref:LCP family protein n=1 Tax=Clostridium sp. Marseille-P299 TaxID=1805477 RepID=UPI00082CFD57|nr:LCP family protein [Clostridium sp. Marseille-P299]